METLPNIPRIFKSISIIRSIFLLFPDEAYPFHNKRRAEGIYVYKNLRRNS